MSTTVLLPDGVGVRNFVLGPFLRKASEKGLVDAYHRIPEHLVPVYGAELNGNVRWHPLLTFRERPVSFLLRYALAYAHLCWGDTQAMRFARKLPVRGSWKARTAVHAARIVGRAAASASCIRTLDSLHCSAVARSPEVLEYRRQFQQIRTSVLFCSHQRPLEVLPAVLAARTLGIPTATFIFSWDNLTSKGRIAAPFDYYLVWSDQMRRELVQFYPDVAPDRVHVVGTPQFEPYVDNSLLWSREEFFRRIGADPHRPLICYSAGEPGTTPEDHKHVRILMELIRDGQIQGNPQVLLRPAPVVDDSARFADVRQEFAELIYAPPQWRHTEPGKWVRVIPTREDVQFLANLTQHADLNVNMASTMTLDFALHDRPVVNVAFDVADPPPFALPVWEYYYRFEHYRPVVELGAARFARSPAELAAHINAYLQDPTLDRAARKRLVALEVGIPLGESSGRIIDVLEAIGA